MTRRTARRDADVFCEAFASEARQMTAPKTLPAGRALEAPAFRSGALWLLGSALGLVCLPGFCISQLPDPQSPLTVGLLVMVMVAVAAELPAMVRPAAAFNNMLLPGEAVLVFGLAFTHPLGLLAARLSVTAVSDALRHRHPSKVVFNAALTAAETLAAVAVYRALLQGGYVASGRGVGAAAAAVATSTAIGLVLLATVHALHDERVSRRTLLLLGSLTPAGLALGLGLVLGLSALAS
jgi:hypothetical protein